MQEGMYVLVDLGRGVERSLLGSGEHTNLKVVHKGRHYDLLGPITEEVRDHRGAVDA